MRPDGVVVLAPLADDDLGFFQAIEDFAVEQFIPQLCRHAICVDSPWPIATSIWRRNVTICSALNLFFGMTSFLSKSVSNKPLGTKRASQVSRKPSFFRNRSNVAPKIKVFVPQVRDAVDYADATRLPSNAARH